MVDIKSLWKISQSMKKTVIKKVGEKTNLCKCNKALNFALGPTSPIIPKLYLVPLQNLLCLPIAYLQM